MRRRWIPIKDLSIYDEFHYQVGDSFEVNVELDGNTTEYHKEGIEVIKEIIKSGSKTLPILVADDGGGHYQLLDGFKRSRAHIELGREHIEALICTPEEVSRRQPFVLHGGHGWAGKGGLNYETFPLFEGAEKRGVEYAGTTFLYNSPRPNGLKIEVSECIHCHWGEYGRYRLALGRRDFVALAEAVSKI